MASTTDPVGQRSLITKTAYHIIEFLNKWFVLSRWLIKGDKDVFYRVEKLLLFITLLVLALLFFIGSFSYKVGLVICIILAQRVLEFLVVYARNFIFNQGRIFTEFKDVHYRGEWLILMFILNVIQITLVFAVWYRFIGVHSPDSFSAAMNIMNSFYFSVITFLTVGYGDIIPMTDTAKTLVIIQSALTFYTFVVVVNGLISIHFTAKD